MSFISLLPSHIQAPHWLSSMRDLDANYQHNYLFSWIKQHNLHFLIIPKMMVHQVSLPPSTISFVNILLASFPLEVPAFSQRKCHACWTIFKATQLLDLIPKVLNIMVLDHRHIVLMKPLVWLDYVCSALQDSWFLARNLNCDLDQTYLSQHAFSIISM